jgi:Ala-tRNA(Pro) deacylase
MIGEKMKKEAIYQYLDERGIQYTVINHPPAYTMDDIESCHLPHPEYEAKNLFLRDDKKKNYYLLTIKGDTPIDLRTFQQNAMTRRLTFASESDLMNILGLDKGAVSPFGILNDESRLVKVFLDSYFEDKQICLHPNDNTASVYMQTSELFKIIQSHGNWCQYYIFTK